MNEGVARIAGWVALAALLMAAAPAHAAEIGSAPIQRPRTAVSPTGGDSTGDAPELQRPATQTPGTGAAPTEPTVAALPEHAVTEPAIPEHAVTEHAIPEHAVTEHAVTEHAVTEHAVTGVADVPAAAPAEVPAASLPTARRGASPPAPHPTAVGTHGIRTSAAPHRPEFAHHGFVTDLRLGTLGCLRGLCGGGHNVRPGFRVDGFVGGNIRGFVDIGVAGGWGQMGSDVAEGTNVLSLYGLDPFLLQQALGVLGGRALDVDLTSLNATGSKLRAAQAGPLLRVHFIPRGRFAAYVGSGVQYNLFRARYDTPASETRVDFHGLAVPIEAGFGVHVHEHVAVGVQFDYLWTWYALAKLDHGGSAITVPVRILDDAARMQNSSLRSQLPQFWTFGVMLRARV